MGDNRIGIDNSMNRFVLALACLSTGLVLGGCPSPSLPGATSSPIVRDPTTQIAAIESVFGAAVAGELVYLNSPNPDHAVVRQLEAYRIAAHAVLAPIATGPTPSSSTVLAAKAAVSALTSYMDARGITYQKGS